MVTGSVAEKRLLLARLAETRDSSEGGRQGRTGIGRTGMRVMLVILTLALATLLWLWISGFFATPKEVLDIRAMVDEQIVELGRVARNEAPLTYDTSVFRESVSRVRDMAPDVRAQVRSEMERLGRARDKAELQSYFALPPAERRDELDRRIKAEELRRQASQQRGSEKSVSQKSSRGGGSGQGAGPRDASQAVSASPPGGRGPGGGGPARRGGTEEERNTRRKQRLDTSSPEARAQGAEYRRAMAARRQQLGLGSGRGRGG
jgi:hypothetical protein